MLSLTLHKMVASHSELLMADHQHKSHSLVSKQIKTTVSTDMSTHMFPKHSSKSDVNMTCHFGRLLCVQLDIYIYIRLFDH